MKRDTLAKRFWEKVNILGPNECWEWTAKAKTSFGYGRMTNGRGVHLKSHRISWTLSYGPIPDGMCVCHKCDNPGCCNPAHLFLGSKKDNTKDMMAKGRMSPPPIRSGETHHNATIRDCDIDLIRGSQLSRKVLAEKYGVSYQTIYRIQKGQSRAHENI